MEAFEWEQSTNFITLQLNLEKLKILKGRKEGKERKEGLVSVQYAGCCYYGGKILCDIKLDALCAHSGRTCFDILLDLVVGTGIRNCVVGLPQSY